MGLSRRTRSAPAIYGALMAAHEAGTVQDAGMGRHRPGSAATDTEAGFDAHVFASIIAIAAAEADARGDALAGHLGVGCADLERLFARYFSPHAFLSLGVPIGEAQAGEEEEMLSALLLDYARTMEARILAHMVARRAMEADHLWQDLGLGNRGELSRLLGRHFPVLAAGNVKNMKWKKYFYRRLCEAEGFVLCSAPSCRDCSDFEACFGDESGESRLAQRRRAAQLDLAIPAEALSGAPGAAA
ncbi:nitrogen fixation protein NifQ [Aquabacter sp. L1I39]|uniref:nitrogen fixation protein NifQ n=1 Tax=Aquabacter sp. L1I39 TaxID=2820278 RepID=UPI001AD9C2B5|nr:nitrogen fixation protein NifQ [Aquabacter sp. L1I39]QTL04480.1 nitrogen fixation protein NifQ [Aquabacter sp. L1I39]